MKERFRSALNSSHSQWARLTQELKELSQGIEAAADRKLRKQTKERMGILQTAFKKVEASMAESEDHLKESWMREEEAHQEDRGQSDSSEEQDGDIVVEEAEGSGPAGAETVGPLRSQEAEPTMQVDVGDILPLTSEDATTVTPKEDEMLMGNPISVAGEMARLQVTPLDSHKPEDGKTS